MNETELRHRFIQACRIVNAAGSLALDYFNRRHELAVESKGMQDSGEPCGSRC